MTDRIAILGWGSLLWDLDNLQPHVNGDWARAAGPRLPLEFCRISPKRKMGLTVVIDADHGADCPVSLIVSNRADIEAAAQDLAARERAALSRIGFVERDAGRGRAADQTVIDRVGRWCAEAGWAGAVWTDLPGNFVEHTGQSFALKTAVSYLQTLQGESLEEAHRYIESAPPETDTPLRRRLASDAWWIGLRTAPGAVSHPG
ncbi:MAG: hypothetical protein AAFW88_11800 [Pseudomonadota bacterium]